MCQLRNKALNSKNQKFMILDHGCKNLGEVVLDECMAMIESWLAEKKTEKIRRDIYPEGNNIISNQGYNKL
jgi:hypothetical protein